nr:immunoglobulin heavy chain junction region [Macaca mulatta]
CASAAGGTTGVGGSLDVW